MSIAATTTVRRSNPDHIRSAFVCGLIPLITGTSIFLLWLLTRWDWLYGLARSPLLREFFSFSSGSPALLRLAWTVRQ